MRDVLAAPALETEKASLIYVLPYSVPFSTTFCLIQRQRYCRSCGTWQVLRASACTLRGAARSSAVRRCCGRSLGDLSV
jgi:hypothetical protein